MIPVSLSLSGFLSYRHEASLDFTSFDLACIAGANGAGKSSLLDAMTWVLFGQARKRDESLINMHPDTDAAQVRFSFQYEGNLYRVERVNPKGKTSALEFHIATNPDAALRDLQSAIWKPLTERTIRETQTRLEEVLRLDYETFVNAAFFLQGNADQFTQQRSGDRKRILGTILGLEVWETYRGTAAARRRDVEADIAELDGRLQEIDAELAEETDRRDRFRDLKEELERLERNRREQEKILDNMRKIQANLQEQRKWVEALSQELSASSQRLNDLESKLHDRTQERSKYLDTLSRALAIREGYQNLQEVRSHLKEMDELVPRFHEQNQRRFPLLADIEKAEARLKTELESLLEQKKDMEAAESEVQELEAKIENTQASVEVVEKALAQRAELEERLQEALKRQAEAKAENPLLKAEMDELKLRLDQLEKAEGAVCPVCGQPLSTQDRQRLLEDYQSRGKEMGDRYRENSALLRDADTLVADLQARIGSLQPHEVAYRNHLRELDQLTAEGNRIKKDLTDWKERSEPRIEEIRTALEKDTYAPEARASLSKVDAELKEIGYDAAAHDRLRREVEERSIVEGEMRSLEKAEAALEPLDREIADLEKEVESQMGEVQRRRNELQKVSDALVELQSQAPDLRQAERDLLDLQEQANRMRIEVGGAQQKVEILTDLKERRETLECQRDDLTQQVARFKQLERAFGKDGVPALLIEQALPQIETKANEILERLSAGTMNVRFITQREYKDKRRDDLRETLDIQISDSAGIRDYEMYSGGEAFRVNFAIRLALSEILAQRAGARLQTLVIDEGFGSQDAIGRQRLIEAINMVRDDFAKILVITHIDELKDAFPNRIEVSKTDQGSSLRVI